MSDNGWIKLHRKILESPLFKDPQALTLWVHLLLRANHKDNKVMIGNRFVMVKRGQLLTGRKKLSAYTGINESKLERLLKLMESEQQIEQQTFTKYRLISITNYNKYQDTEQQTNSKRTASEQQVNTNKNVKNENNEKKESLPPNLNIKVWEGWLKHRSKLKLKAYTSDLAAKKLAKLSEEKQKACVLYSIENNYQGLFPEKFSDDNGLPKSDNDLLGYADKIGFRQPRPGESWKDFRAAITNFQSKGEL